MSGSLTEQALARGVRVQSADTAHAQAQQMANHVLDGLRQAVVERGSATLAVSGGRSPALLFGQLEAADFDWSKVTLTLADERWVAPDDPQSNAGLVQRCMPTAFARSRWVPLYRGQGLEADAAAVARDVRPLLPLDVLVLGVGPDGHTASLFPNAAGLDEALREDSATLCRAVPAEAERLPRLTLTAAVLRHARMQLLQVNGDHKREVIAEAFRADPQRMPIAAFLRPPLIVFDAPDSEEIA